MQVKVVGQISRSNAQNSVLTSQLPCFQVKVKGKGQDQRSGSRSKVKVNLWCLVVDIRGSALLSAAKSKDESLPVQSVYQ